MSLHLTSSHIDRMTGEARAAAPEECCGILIGRREGERAFVGAVEPAGNVWEGDRRSRFMVEPRAHLRVQRESRAAGLEIVGFYHSHPHSPPVPSLFDQELAWPEHSYVIISLLEGRPAIRSWRLDETAQRFAEEPLVVDGV